jgi:hypothetical protein
MGKRSYPSSPVFMLEPLSRSLGHRRQYRHSLDSNHSRLHRLRLDHLLPAALRNGYAIDECVRVTAIRATARTHPNPSCPYYTTASLLQRFFSPLSYGDACGEDSSGEVDGFYTSPPLHLGIYLQ